MDKLKYNYLNIPTIDTKRLILNSPLEKDYETIQCFLKSERSKFIGGPYTSFTSWSDYMANIGHWSAFGYGLWSVRIKTSGDFIGRVGIISPPMFSEPDLAWQLFDGFEGKGYAFEAAKAVKDYVLENFKLDVNGTKREISSVIASSVKERTIIINSKDAFLFTHTKRSRYRGLPEVLPSLLA